jgi:hypothetical protein
MGDKCVHTEHCCLKHGCKYGDDDCPVESGAKFQSFDCEACYEEKGDPNFLRINTLETEAAKLRGELAVLRNAIKAHKESFSEEDYVYVEEDSMLWSVLTKSAELGGE